MTLFANDRCIAAACLAAVLWAGYHSEPARGEDSPVATVNAAIGSFSAAVAGYREDGSGENLAGVIVRYIDEYADIDGASRIILGQHVQAASEGQRAAFSQALEQRVVELLREAVPDMQFDDITIEPFDGRLDELPVVVKVRIPLESGDMAVLSLRMHDRRGNWRIIDVAAEGVSYLRTFRTEFSNEVRRYGLDRAIERFAPH